MPRCSSMASWIIHSSASAARAFNSVKLGLDGVEDGQRAFLDLLDGNVAEQESGAIPDEKILFLSGELSAAGAGDDLTADAD